MPGGLLSEQEHRAVLAGEFDAVGGGTANMGRAVEGCGDRLLFGQQLAAAALAREQLFGDEPAVQVSRLTPERSETFECHAFVEDLTKAWRGTLDW